MAKFKFYLYMESTGFNCEEIIDIPDKELDGLSVEEKTNHIYKNYYEDWLGNKAVTGFYEIDC